MQRNPSLRRFQSLSGFQVRCNQLASHVQPVRAGGFNPYRVFKFAATLRCAICGADLGKVSIPIGFSSSLQHQDVEEGDRNMKIVSIPIGFSSSLQRVDGSNVQRNEIVSIPIGFSSSLQHNHQPAGV